MLLLKFSKKPDTGIPMTSSHLTLNDLKGQIQKGQIQGHSDFEGLCLLKEPSWAC